MKNSMNGISHRDFLVSSNLCDCVKSYYDRYLVPAVAQALDVQTSSTCPEKKRCYSLVSNFKAGYTLYDNF